MRLAGEAGLADDIDDYMKIHLDSIEKGDPKPGFGRTDMKEAIDFYWNQQKRGWVDYAIGKLMVQTGSEPVSVMSPAYDYHKGRSFPVYKEVK